MISLDIIEREISDLETRDTSYNVVERLAWLYVCRDHLKGETAQAALLAEPSSDSTDFLAAASGVPVAALLDIINDHLEHLRIVYPKCYETIMHRISEIKN